MDLNWFLRFGHFLAYRSPLCFDFSRVDRGEYARRPLAEIEVLFRRAFLDSMQRLFRSNAEHVVPLSGGFDSRAVLGFLLELTPASNIRTFSFGTPGSSDFEIGGRIARLAGTRHTSFPMTGGTWRLEDLLAVSRRTHSQTRLFHTPPVLAIERSFGGALAWSGFLGELVAGASLPEERHATQEEAFPYYLAENRHPCEDLTDCEPEELYEGMRLRHPVSPETVRWYEQISLQTEESLLTAPHVLHAGLEDACPFLDPELLGIMLSLPDPLRRRRRGYKRLLIATLPRLFSLPSKSNDDLPLGSPPVYHLAKKFARRFRRSVNRVHPLFHDRRVNYLDFQRELATNPSFERLLEGCLRSLAGRGSVPWIDIDRLWSSGASWRRKHLEAILLLASLEIHLQAGRSLGRERTPDSPSGTGSRTTGQTTG